MNKRILLVFPGLRPHLNEGAKHRLNSYIENYKTQGYIVDVLCFYRDISYIGRLNKYINSNANWHFGKCIYNHRTTKTNQKYPSVNL